MAIKIDNIGNVVTPAGASAIFGVEATEDKKDILTPHTDTYSPYSIVYIEDDEEDTWPADQISYSPPGDSNFEATNVQEALDQFEDLVNNNVPQLIKEIKTATEGQKIFALSQNFQEKGMLVFYNGLLLNIYENYTYAGKTLSLIGFTAEEGDTLTVVGLASSGGSMTNERITLDLTNATVGTTFNYGMYQVESEDPWEIEWEVVDDTDPNYIIAQTKSIIDLRCFDAKESSNTDSNRSKYGNNNWQYSNIKQFLNSDSESWYSSQHTYDAPPISSNVYNSYNPYDTHKGFLYYFSDIEKAYLQDMTLTLANNTVTDGGGSYTWTGKVWLPTYTQMGYGTNNSISEGTQFSKYTDNSSRIKYLHEKCAENNSYAKAQGYTSSKAWWYWMSSAAPSVSYYAWLVDSVGSGSNSTAYNGNGGLAPCIKLPRKKLSLTATTSSFTSSSIITYGTDDLIAGESALPTGTLYVCYE